MHLFAVLFSENVDFLIGMHLFAVLFSAHVEFLIGKCLFLVLCFLACGILVRNFSVSCHEFCFIAETI